MVSISGVGTSPLYATRTADPRVRDSGSTFASALKAATSTSGEAGNAGVQTTDFTHMTRKDLAEWVNSKIKSGEMSLDGSEAFISMTAHMPVNGAYAGLDDSEQVDFMQTAQSGMAWAQQHGAADMLASLQAALTTMQRYQGTATSVDRLA